MATYKDMFKRIARHAGFDATDSAFSDGSDNTAFVKELINESNKINGALVPLRPKTSTITLTSGQADYALPADFQQMRYVHYNIGTRKIEIFPTGENNFLTLESVVSSSTVFAYYTIRYDESSGTQTKKIWIFPSASTTGQEIYIDYLAGATELNTDPTDATAANTVLFAPPQFDSIDKLYAFWKIFDQREQPQQADRYKKDYQELFETFKGFVAKRRESMVVKPGLRTQTNPNLFPTLTQS